MRWGIECFLEDFGERGAINIIQNLKTRATSKFEHNVTSIEFDFEQEIVQLDYYYEDPEFPIIFTFTEIKCLLLGHFANINLDFHELQQLLQYDYYVWNLRYDQLKEILVKKAKELAMESV